VDVPFNPPTHDAMMIDDAVVVSLTTDLASRLQYSSSSISSLLLFVVGVVQVATTTTKQKILVRRCTIV
jgi:hypothetical protein